MWACRSSQGLCRLRGEPGSRLQTRTVGFRVSGLRKKALALGLALALSLSVSVFGAGELCTGFRTPKPRFLQVQNAANS